jgi:hypothetical protein
MKPWWQTLVDVIAAELAKRWLTEQREQSQPIEFEQRLDQSSKSSEGTTNANRDVPNE